MFRDEIAELVNRQFEGRTDLKFLEAGCGSASHFKFIGISKSVGIDISRVQLDRNTAIQEKILGDLQTYPLAMNEFDLAVCWDVIEHLSRPQEALRNLFNSVKPGGLVVLGFPHVASFKGLMTKFTPHWFHVFVYHKIMKYKGTPFPSYLRLTILPKNVVRIAEDHGYSVLMIKLVEGKMTTRLCRWPLIRPLFSSIDALFRLVSGRKAVSLFVDNCGVVLKHDAPKRLAAAGEAAPSLAPSSQPSGQ